MKISIQKLYKAIQANIPMKFTPSEIKALIKSWILISIAFGIVLSEAFFSKELLINIGISLITVGVAFLLHELAHKYFAQKYHCQAEYKSFDFMLLIALITSFLGIILAAPGAVYIQGYTTKKQNGIISAAGPATNIILAIIALPLFFITTGLTHHIITLMLTINAMLAIFNLLPFAIFDGKKVYDWNKGIWMIMLLTSLALAITSFYF